MEVKYKISVIMCYCMTCVIVFGLIFINIKYLPKIEYRGSSLQYPIKYTPPIYEGLKPHSIRLQESILKVHLHLSSPPPHECQMQDVKIFLWDVYLPDVSHHHVDESVFYQTQEHEKCAGGHEHVNGLKYKITPNM